MLSHAIDVACSQIIESSVVERETADLRTDQDYEVFLTPVVPELTSTSDYHRKIMIGTCFTSVLLVGART